MQRDDPIPSHTQRRPRHIENTPALKGEIYGELDKNSNEGNSNEGSEDIMTEDQRRLKEKLEALGQDITQTITETKEGLSATADLQLVALEGLADSNEQQAEGSLATFGGLADLMDALLDIGDRLAAIEEKLG